MEDYSCYNAPGTPLRAAQQRMLEILKEIDKICKRHNITYWLDGGTMIGCVRHKGFIPWDDDLDIAVFYEDYHRLLNVLGEELPKQFRVEWSGNNSRYPYSFAKVVDTNSYVEQAHDEWTARAGITGLWVDIFPMVKGCRTIRRIVEPLYGRCYQQSRGMDDKRWKRVMAYILYPLAGLMKGMSWVCTRFVSNDMYVNSYGTGHLPTQNATRRRSWTLPTVDMEFEGEKFPMPCNYDAILTTMYGDYMKVPPEEKRQIHLCRFAVYDISENKD